MESRLAGTSGIDDRPRKYLVWAMALSGLTMSPRRIPGLGRGTAPGFSEYGPEDRGAHGTGGPAVWRPVTFDGETARLGSTPASRSPLALALLSASAMRPGSCALASRLASRLLSPWFWMMPRITLSVLLFLSCVSTHPRGGYPMSWWLMCCATLRK